MALAHAGLMLKHQDPATKEKALAPKRGGSDGKAQWFKAGNISKGKDTNALAALWLYSFSLAW